MGQVFSGSHGSWVTRSDPSPTLISQRELGGQKGGAEGVEGEEEWRCPPPQPTMGSGGASYASPAGSGRKRVLEYFDLLKPMC